MQDASKLNWALKSFPKEDFRGFWICYSTKNLLSNDTKISFLQIFSGFNPISTGLFHVRPLPVYMFLWHSGDALNSQRFMPTLQW